MKKCGIFSPDLIGKTLLGLIPAYFFASLASMICEMVSGLLVGNLMIPEAIAAVGLASPYLRIFTAVSTVFAGGFRVACGQFMGRGDLRSIREHFASAVLALLGIGGLLTVAGLTLADPVAGLLGASGDMRIRTAAYIRGISAGAVPTVLVPLLMVTCQMNNQGRKVLIASGIQTAVSCGVGFAVMKTMPENLFTAGIASAAGLLAAGVYLAAGLRERKGEADRLSVRAGDFRLRAAADMVRIGAPAAVMQLAGMLTVLGMNNLVMAYAGHDGISAIALRNYIYIVSDAVAVGVGQAAGAMVSVATGEGDRDQIRKIVRRGVLTATVLTALVTLLFAGPSDFWAGLFGAKGKVRTYTADYVTACLLSSTLFAAVQVVTATFQAMGAVGIATFSSVLTDCALPLSGAFLLSRIFGIGGFWWLYTFAETVYLLLVFILSAVRMKKLPEGFGGLFDWVRIAAPEATLHQQLDGPEKTSENSVELQNFLREHGITEKNAMFCALCTEEMCANIVQHGFRKSGKKQGLTVHIFASVENGEATVRIRDNAVPFDPWSKMRMHTADPDDPCRNIGIRLVTGLAKEMTYQSIFGLNVVTIRM